MFQTELIFRGLDADECTSFIREVHKRAHEAGRLRDNAWIADIAMIAFDGDALKWFDEQAAETQADWALLRRQLLQRYCSDNSGLVPEQQEATEASSSTISASGMKPSNRLTPASNSEPFFFNIQVASPKARYKGYVSERFDETDLGRCCTLTQDSDNALKIKAILCDDAKAFKEVILLTADSGEEESALKFVAPHTPSEVALHSILALWLPLKVGMGENKKQRYGVKDGEAASDEHCTWKLDSEGKLKPDLPTGTKTMITRTTSGGLTITFWGCRVWDDDDDVYVADLNLIRSL